MIKVIELFSGIGSQHSALKRLGIDFEVIGIAEIDKYAIKSYEAIHGKANNFGDISQIEKLPQADFWTYSFPCQDLSVAGKQRGIKEGTRSGLLYEVERLLEVSKEHDELPKYLMLENVKNLVGKKFKPDFDKWLGKLDQLGYNTYWKVLNAKHYGVPQNRERVFAISIRKDVDKGYQFPEGFDNGLRLKDILEEEVDEKFYISNEKADKLLLNIQEKTAGTAYKQGTEFKESDVSVALCARDYKGFGNQGMAAVVEVNDTPKRLGNIYGEDKGTGFASNVWDKGHLSPTLTTMQGGNREPMIIDNIKIPQATTKGYIECSVPGVFDMTYPDSKTRRGRVQDHGEIVPTLTAASQDIMYIEPNVLSPKRTEYGKAIRKEYEAGIIEESRHNMTTMEPRSDGICNTLTTVQKDNYVLEPKINVVYLPQQIKVRKHEVDIENLKGLLRRSKGKLTNKDIAEHLNKPITLVEHWFRNDSCFSIPDAEIWYKLKEILNIQTDEFDLSVMEFIEREGTYEKSERHYMTDGIAPTLTSATADEKIIEPSYRIRKLTPLETFRLMGFTDEEFYKAQAVNSNSQLYRQSGNSIVVDVLYYLFRNLFLEVEEGEYYQQMKII